MRWPRWRGCVAPRQWWSVITGVMWCVGIGSSLLHPDLCHQEDHLNNHYGNKARLLLPSHPDLLHGASCLVVLGEARGHCCDTWSVAAWALCLCWPQVRRGAETMLVSHSRTAPDHQSSSIWTLGYTVHRFIIHNIQRRCLLVFSPRVQCVHRHRPCMFFMLFYNSGVFSEYCVHLT